MEQVRSEEEAAGRVWSGKTYQARPISIVSAVFCLSFPQVLVPGGRTVPIH